MIKKKQRTAQKKRRFKSIGLAVLFGVLLLTALFSIQLLKNLDGQNLQGSQTVWGDGTDKFYKEVLASNGEWLNSPESAIFDNQAVTGLPKEETERILSQAEQTTQVLGLHTASDGSEKWIEVDLSDYKLYAWEGNRKVFEFSTSTGRPGFNTPTGEFRVWRKVKYQRYVGGTGSGYYNLPNVPYSLFWSGGRISNWKGYAIHGAYWHNDFGLKNRSSGCVNLKPAEAGLLYSWASPTMPNGVNALNATADNPGIRVVVHN